ncbi:PREDICTED: testis-expressed sequence 10 protein isoform X1 [Cyprinodon variegatus]|uniref:Testis expressed 10 n=1 Tax=Cyprinodon variegatus TaxID=28743 RepID=A0A3Q2E0V9_CYPVA|nr:PREDICTED: testis-expressed sequence 10 protein isoform X1 [Cyprinodon variegatus]XP_015226104.1 PREDICTED: testis-expressed sequence 10 protein isoform X1 [Cyprinodon variegatus]
MKAKKKKRQDDFQKVKLKVGKKKPRADNATNTNFRTRGISLPEQLKRETSGPTTHKQLGINELLSQLHHYNANVKHGALLGLKELLSLSPSLLDQHLSRLLSEVAAVLTDKDGNVRVAATRVLRFVARSVPAERVAPFFPLLSAHLTCAMTHIEPGIQEDAMNVLDIFLEYYPSLLASRPAVLLTNFLEQISHRQSSGGIRKTLDAKGRTWALSVHPDRRVTSQQWRLSVLLRLGNFLQAVVEERPTEEGDLSVRTEGVFGSSGKHGLSPLNLKWEELIYKKIDVKVYENSGAKPTPHSTFKLRPEVDTGGVGSESLESAESIQMFAATLVPLLLEVWVEACAGDRTWNSSEGAHLLTPDAMSVMFQVLTILQLLRKLPTQRENQDALDAWFRKEYLGDFKQHFMKNFPYGLRDTPKHKRKIDLKRSKQSAAIPAPTVEPLALNITLCQVMVSLSQKQGPGQEADGDWLSPLRAFIRDTLGNGVRLSYRQLHMLLGTVWKMVLTQRSRAVTEELLAAVYIYYKQKNLPLQTRSLLLSFYSKLYLQEQGHAHISRSKVLCRWLASLPVQLSQLGHRNPTLSAQLIISIQAAASRGNKDLLNSLQTYACRLYDPQDGVVVLLPAESQQRMVQLLYFLPKMPQPLLANLSGCCTAGRISAGLAASLIRIIHFRSSLSGWSVGTQEAALQDVDYISFLFSTLAGFSSEHLSALQEDETALLASSLSPLCLYQTPQEQFTHHWDVVEEVCHCLETIGSKSQCFDILQNGIFKYLMKLEVVPDSMAAGLLRAVSRLLDLSILPVEQLLRFLSQCCLSLLVLLVILQQHVPTEANHKREAIWTSCVTALSSVPRLLRMVLQSMHVGDLSAEELPQLGQILSMLLQHTPLHNQLMANTVLLQELIQNLTRFSRGAPREQWLTDLLYCYSVTMAHGSSAHRGSMGLRDMY